MTGMDTGDQMLNEVYRDRNLAVQMAAILALLCAYDVVVFDDPKEPDWPVLCIELPQGQVTWHIHKDDLLPFFARDAMRTPSQWDGHTTDEKHDRMKKFVEGHTARADLAEGVS